MALHDHPGGIIVVDKPADMSSAKVVAIVKRLLNAKKVGHAGTLDPFATGVLVCLINKATRLSNFLLKGEKIYEATLCLGVKTDTQDKTGNIISISENIDFSIQTIHRMIKEFEGESEQMPPVYSALKHKGTPLYKLARAGKPVQKPARKIFIRYINILDVCLPEIRFEISCSAGTYIRTLCTDIGDALGCGGHLKELRRIESSGFSISNALTLPELKTLSETNDIENQLVSMRYALPDAPEYGISCELMEKIKNGALINKTALTPNIIEDRLVKVIDKNGQLIAVLKNVKELPYYQYCCVLAT